MYPLRGLFALGLFCLASLALAASPLELSAPDAHQRQQAGELLLIDVRTPQEWRQTGVAAGVVRINMRHPAGPQGFVNALLQQVGGDKAAPIGLICRTGNRTTQLQRYLQAQGFTQVYNIREGMAGSLAGPGWLRRGLPVEDCRQC